jgi:hypothetical protein
MQLCRDGDGVLADVARRSGPFIGGKPLAPCLARVLGYIGEFRRNSDARYVSVRSGRWPLPSEAGGRASRPALRKMA